MAVFEVLNEVRREILIAATEDSPSRELERLQAQSRSPISHWDPKDLRTGCLRVIEADMAASAAPAFVRLYAQTDLPEGWRYVTREPAGEGV